MILGIFFYIGFLIVSSQGFQTFYTFQNQIPLYSLNISGYGFQVSSDSKWLAYVQQGQNISNCIVFMKKQAINQKQRFKYCISTFNNSIKFMKYNKYGDVLVVVTKNNQLFKCTIQYGYKIVDCYPKYTLDSTHSAVVNYIDINKSNLTVVTSLDGITILKISDNGFSKVDYYSYAKATRSLQAFWHPLYQDLVIVAGKYNTSSAQGFLSAYNITSKTENTQQRQGLQKLRVLSNSSYFLVAFSDTLYLYTYENDTFNYIFYLGNILSIDDIRASKQGSLFYMRRYLNEYTISSAALFEAYQLKIVRYQTNETNSTVKYNVTMIPFLKTIIYAINWDYQFTISPDGNQVLLYHPINNKFYIDRHVICPDKTYFNYYSDTVSYYCGSCGQCSTCYGSSKTQCTSCGNTDQLFPQNGTCVNCSTSILGCYKCLNQQICLKCYGAGWNLTEDGVCQCADFYFKNGYSCDSCNKNCKKCLSQRICSICDISQDYEQSPKEGICVCKSGYSLNNINKCEPQNSTTYTIIIIIGASVVVIGIIIFVIRRRQKKRKQQKLKQQQPQISDSYFAKIPDQQKVKTNSKSLLSHQ